MPPGDLPAADILRSMTPGLLRALAALAVAAPAAFAEPPKDETPKPADRAGVEPGALAPAGYPGGEATAARMRAIVSSAKGRAALVPVAVSRERRPVQAIVLGADAKGRRPAMLLVGGMDGVNLASTEQVLASLETIVREHPAILDTMRIYAIPEANPDARAWAMTQGRPRATNARMIDDDRDGWADEDGPSDANGDGVVSMIRRIAPPGEAATHLVDAVDSRIVRTANREKAEIATHQLFVEGIDRDGDGLVAEDGEGGVDLDRNFPHRWPEFAADAGPYQLSEPESIAIARFVRERPEIVTAVVFGRHDTLVNFPDAKDKDATGRTPVAYLAEDHGLYRQLSTAWKESTKIERSDGAELGGSLVLWLANHRGIAAVAANGWSRPELPKPPEGAEVKETGDAEQAAWLALSDGPYGSRGFVAWKPWTHPTLGACEIGGFMPSFRESPTHAQSIDLAARTAPFVARLAEWQPKVEVAAARATPLADGLVRIEARIASTGKLATTTEMGRISEAVPPVVVRLVAGGRPVSPELVLQGRPVEKLARLEPGATREFQWIVRAPSDARVEVSVTGPFFDEIRVQPAGGVQ